MAAAARASWEAVRQSEATSLQVHALCPNPARMLPKAPICRPWKAILHRSLCWHGSPCGHASPLNRVAHACFSAGVPAALCRQTARYSDHVHAILPADGTDVVRGQSAQRRTRGAIQVAEHLHDVPAILADRQKPPGVISIVAEAVCLATRQQCAASRKWGPGTVSR